MKAFLICLITVFLLFSFISTVTADVLRVEPEISCTNLRIDGGAGDYSFAKPILSLGLHSEADLKILRMGLDLGYGNAKDFSYLTLTPRAGWEFWFRDYKFRIYEGYKVFRLTDLASPNQTYDFEGFIFGADIESKISEMFSWTGSLTIPETCSYRYNGDFIAGGSPADSGISQADWRIGLKFTLLPLYDILIGYHATSVSDQAQNFKITANGLTASLNITY